MQMSDGPIELLSRARSGDTEALGELCILYRNFLRKVVRKRLGSKLGERVEISDVVQEVFVEIVRQFPKFTGENEVAVMGWMQRLVSQRLADLGRYHFRVKRAGDAMALPLDVDPETRGLSREASGRLLDKLALSQTSPSQVVSKREQFDVLAGALAGLAEQEADVLWCYFVDGLSFEAIGQRLNLSRKSVSRIVGQSLRKLKRSLDGPPGGALRYDEGPVRSPGLGRQTRVT
jgi:RNA polymerase sigma-70 factor (ECF subfamily)